MLIDRRDLEKLARTHAVPAVTLTMGIDRDRPGNTEDPRRLRRLVDSTRERLLRDHGHNGAATVVDRLEQVGSTIDWLHPSDGLAIFATAAETIVYTLPFRVRDRIVIDDTFSIREVLYGLQRARRYRVLVLSGKHARLFEGSGDRVEEVDEQGFPFALPARPVESTPHRDLPRHEHRDAEGHHFAFRTVDRALNERNAGDPLPLIVVGVERDIVYFDDVTAHGRVIVGRVHGDHTRDTAAQIATLVAPYVERHYDEQEGAAVALVEAAASADRVARDPEAIWHDARDGRGQCLVVETSFVLPAVVVDGELAPAPEAEPDEDTAEPDGVDAIIEAVVLHGGDAVVVPDGALGTYAPIALVRRY